MEKNPGFDHPAGGRQGRKRPIRRVNKPAERKFFFALTLMMLLLGIICKLGIL